MNKEFIAYCVTHILDGKKYIGITSCGLPKRWAEHKADCKNPVLCIRRHQPKLAVCGGSHHMREGKDELGAAP